MLLARQTRIIYQYPVWLKGRPLEVVQSEPFMNEKGVKQSWQDLLKQGWRQSDSGEDPPIACNPAKTPQPRNCMQSGEDPPNAIAFAVCQVGCPR